MHELLITIIILLQSFFALEHDQSECPTCSNLYAFYLSISIFCSIAEFLVSQTGRENVRSLCKKSVSHITQVAPSKPVVVITF